MDLESLKKAMEDAKALADAKPDDAELKAKFAEAKKAYDEAVEEENSSAFDESKADAKTQAYLAKLRKENANHRNKNKDLLTKLSTSEEQKKAILKAAGIETDEQSPEDKLKSLQAESQTLAFRAGILEAAVAQGIGKDDVEYFEFLVAKEAASLQEGEELDDEKMKVIAAKAKRGAGKGAANTSVEGDGKGGSGNPPPPDKGGSITLEKFISMSMVEKSKLYEVNPTLYSELIAQARAKKKLV